MNQAVRLLKPLQTGLGRRNRVQGHQDPEMRATARLARLVRPVPASAARAPAAQLPIVPARARNISAWSYDGGAVSYQRIVIPLALIKALSYVFR